MAQKAVKEAQKAGGDQKKDADRKGAIIMAKWFVKENELYPDSAHRFWLRRDQYTVGELYLGAKEAERVALCVDSCNGIDPEAVPDLLEACKSAQFELSALVNQFGLGFTSPDEHPVIKRLNAVLARAMEEHGHQNSK